MGCGYLGEEMDLCVFDFKGVFCFSFDPAKEKENKDKESNSLKAYDLLISHYVTV